MAKYANVETLMEEVLKLKVVEHEGNAYLDYADVLAILQKADVLVVEPEERGATVPQNTGGWSDWIPVSEQLPPDDLIVDTKIDDEKGVRNVAQLTFTKTFGSSPTHLCMFTIDRHTGDPQ